MPGGDRTGPQGMGPMTGRSAGYCTGNNVPGSMNPAGGRGMAMRRGRFYGGGGGFGRGRGFAGYGVPAVPLAAPVAPIVPQPLYSTVPIDEGIELEALRGQSRELEATISGIQKRIEELEAKNSETKEE
ncbi:DUF5320 domain-containing protein [Candidatus Omnitrophota bacterium]